MWLQEYRVDGLRFDMTVYIRNVDGSNGDAPDDPRNLGGAGWSLLQWVNDEINRSQPWKITIAEDMQGNASVTKDVRRRRHGIRHPVGRAFRPPGAPRAGDARRRGARHGRDALRHRAPAERQPLAARHLHRIARRSRRQQWQAPGARGHPPGRADSWDSKKRSTLGAAMVFTSAGIPMIFQGQEILEWIPFGDQRMDWNKYDRFRGIYHLYRDLIRLRRNWFNNTRGLRGQHVNVFHVSHDDKVIAFHRWDQGGPGDDVVVVLNFGNRAYPSLHDRISRDGRLASAVQLGLERL